MVPPARRFLVTFADPARRKSRPAAPRIKSGGSIRPRPRAPARAWAPDQVRGSLRPRPRAARVGPQGGLAGLVATARGQTPDPIPNSAVKTLSADGTASQDAEEQVAARPAKPPSPNPPGPRLKQRPQPQPYGPRSAGPAKPPIAGSQTACRGVEQPAIPGSDPRIKSGDGDVRLITGQRLWVSTANPKANATLGPRISPRIKSVTKGPPGMIRGPTANHHRGVEQPGSSSGS